MLRITMYGVDVIKYYRFQRIANDKYYILFEIVIVDDNRMIHVVCIQLFLLIKNVIIVKCY
jgi:hypothetical protein